jgi:tRNA threonylcarbamoyladenosine modification (KEOPS) complex Cgi121 subunit
MESEINLNGIAIRSCSSRIAPAELIEKLKKYRGRNLAVQLFDYGSTINRTHILGAYLNAILAFKNNKNISNSISMEMLLFASMTRQISEAIGKIGIRSNDSFVFFSNSRPAYADFKKLLEKDCEFKTTKSHEAAAAKKFGIATDTDYSKAVLQEMAVTRLED